MSFHPSLSFRNPTFRSQPSIRRVPETFEPLSVMKETPEAYLLHVYLPGFTKDLFKIALMDSSRKVRVTGERPFPPNKLRKFDQTYPVPENSEAETLEARFEQGTLILKIQKKSQVPPKQEVEKTQEKSPQDPLDESKPENVQETIPPLQSTTSTKLEEPAKDMKSDSPPTQSLQKMTQKDTHDDISSQIPQQTITNINPQQEFEPKPTSIDRTKTQIDEKPKKGLEEFEPKPTSIDRTKTQIDEKPKKGLEEFEPKPTSIERIKTQINEKAQKGQEEFEPKPTSIDRIKTQINEKAQKGQEEFEPKPTSIERIKTQINEKSQKGQEEFEPKTTSIEKTKTQIDEKPQVKIEPKPRVTFITKEKLEEKKVGMSAAEDSEKEKISKKEIQEKNEMPYDSSKTMKDVKNEIEKAEPSVPQVTENEKESCCRVSPNQEGKNGIRNLASASSQFVTRIAEGKWSGEERHLAENIGAAVLVIAAFGAYVSYWFSS